MRRSLLIFLAGITAAVLAPVLHAQPASPALLPTTNAAITGFTASWTAVGNATGYNLEVSTAADFSQIVWSGAVGNTTSYSVSGNFLQPGTQYYYEVSASNGGSNSTPSNPASVTTDPFPAPLVSGATNITVDSFTVNWIPVPEASNYTMDVSTTPDFGNIVLSGYYLGNGTATGSSNISNFSVYGEGFGTFSSFQPDTTYYYRIYANGAYTRSPPSAIQMLTTDVLAAPEVTGTSNITINSFTTTWSQEPEASGYSIDVSTTADFGNLVVTNEYLGDAPIASAIVNLQYNQRYGQGPNLPPGGTYYYRIRADNGYIASPNSSTQVFSTSVYAAPQSGAATNITIGGFTANWNPAPGATGYNLILSTTPDSSGVFAGYGMSGAATSFTITPPEFFWEQPTVEPGATYYYWVVAADGIINSQNSTVQSVTIPPFPAPQLNAASNITINSFTINWQAVPAATGYEVYVSANAGFSSLFGGITVNGGNATSCNISVIPSNNTVLQPGTTYYYQVLALDGTVISANSTIQSVTTQAFPAPVVNSATNITLNSFTANWEAVPGATEYYMDVSTTPDFGNLVFHGDDLGDGNTTSTSVTGPWWDSDAFQPGTTYYYRIYAQGPNATTPYSATQSFTTLPFPAPQVSAPSQISYNSFTASWSLVPGATGYTIAISTTPDFQYGWNFGGNLGNGNTTSATWSSLPPGTTYYYYIQAEGPDNIISPHSNVLSFTTWSVPLPQLNAPSNITMSSFTASWSAVYGATSYSLDVSTTPDFGNLVVNNEQINSGTNAVVSTPENYGLQIQPDTTYYYRVNANYNYFPLGYSATQTVTTEAFPPPQVDAATDITADSFTANWEIVAGATGYSIDVSTTPDFGNLVINNQYVAGGNTTSANLSTTGSVPIPFEPGSMYYYRIRADGPGVSSADSATQTFTTDPYPAPQVDDATNITLDSFTVNWEPVAGAINYLMDASTTPDFGNLVLTGLSLGDGIATNATVGTSFNGSSAWQPTFQPDTTYYYRIYAQTANFTTPDSATQNVTTAAFPAPQVDAASNITYYSFDANWEPVSGAANYLIDVSTTPDFGNLVVSGLYLDNGDTTTATVSFPPGNVWGWWQTYVLQPNTTYYYRIYAQTGSLNSLDSTTQTVTTAAFPAPLVSAATNITYTGFTANWSAVPGATGYFINVSTTPDFGNLVLSNYDLGDDSSTTSANVTATYWGTLQSNTTYYYQIYAQANNLTSPASTTQTVTTPDFPGPQVTAATNITVDGFTVNWNPVDGATGYVLDLSTTPDFGNLVLSNFDIGDDGSISSADVSTPPNTGGDYGGDGGGFFGGGGTTTTFGGAPTSPVAPPQILMQPDTTYYYRIRANGDNYAVSDNSATQTVTTVVFPAPTVCPATNITYTSFTASWTTLPEATGYNMDISLTPDFGNIVASGLDLGDGNTTSVDTGSINTSYYYYEPLTLQAGTTYYYRIYASGPNDTTSQYSATQTITTVAFPTPAVDPVTNITSSDFTVNWETVPGATGYSIDVSTTADFGNLVIGSWYFDGGDTQSVDVSTANYWYWSQIPILPGTTYYYRVYADGPDYSSQPSTGQSATTLPYTPPTGESAANVTANSFTASWSAIPAASSYLLTVSSTADFGNIVFNADVGNATCYTVNNLQAGTSYYYQVNAYSVLGYTGYSSPASTATAALSSSASAYADWTQSLDLIGANALPTAKPFSDGLTNLVRYAMNLGPSPTNTQLPSIATAILAGTNYLTLQYRELKSLPGYEMVAESSTDLINWTAVPPANIIQLADDDANTARYEATVAIPSQGAVYLRVEVLPATGN
jgi:phosphodiesterase/alkaline phosphatase D-like protein